VIKSIILLLFILVLCCLLIITDKKKNRIITISFYRSVFDFSYFRTLWRQRFTL